MACVCLFLKYQHNDNVLVALGVCCDKRKAMGKVIKAFC